MTAIPAFGSGPLRALLAADPAGRVGGAVLLALARASALFGGPCWRRTTRRRSAWRCALKPPLLAGRRTPATYPPPRHRSSRARRAVAHCWSGARVTACWSACRWSRSPAASALALGLVAGFPFFGGRLDSAIMRLVDTQVAFPGPC